MTLKKDTFFAAVCAVLILSGFPFIITSQGLFLVLIAVALLWQFLSCSNQLKIPKSVLQLFLFQLFLIVFMISILEEFTFNNLFGYVENKIFPEGNMIVNTVIIFCATNLGIIYGYNAQKPLFFASKCLTIFALFFILYVMIIHFNTPTNLEFGLLVTMLMPYVFFYISTLNPNSVNKIQLCAVFLSLLFTLTIANRASFVAIIIFYLAYLSHPYFSATQTIQKFKLLVFVIFHGAIMFAYQSNYYFGLENLSLPIFGKNLDSGRIDIWRELYDIIENSIFFGNGINQSTVDLISESGRNLSSHNMFIEIFYRGGAILFLLVGYYLYWLFTIFVTTIRSEHQRIGQSMFFVFLWISSWQQLGFTLNLAINLLFWTYMGVAAGSVIAKSRINFHPK